MKMGDGEYNQMLTLPKHMGLVFSQTLRRRYQLCDGNHV